MSHDSMKTTNDHQHQSFKDLPDGTSARQVCGNEDGEPIPVVVGGDIDAQFYEAIGTSDKDNTITPIDETIAASKQYKLNAVVCSTSVEGICRILKDGSQIGSIRVGAGNKNGRYDWTPNRVFAAGEVLKVEFDASKTSGKDVDVYVQGRLLDV